MISSQRPWPLDHEAGLGSNVIHMNFMLKSFRGSLGAPSYYRCIPNVTYFSRETWRTSDRFVTLSANVSPADLQIWSSLQILHSAVCLTFRRCPTNYRIFTASLERRVTVSIFWSTSLPCRHSARIYPASVHVCFNVPYCWQARDQ